MDAADVKVSSADGITKFTINGKDAEIEVEDGDGTVRIALVIVGFRITGTLRHEDARRLGDEILQAAARAEANAN